MKYRSKYLPVFMADRDVIRAHLSRFYTGTEKRFFTLVRKKIKQLSDFPLMYPVFEFDPNYRKMVIGDYLLFYIVDEDNKMVEIHRIFHGAQDIRIEFTTTYSEK